MQQTGRRIRGSCMTVDALLDDLRQRGIRLKAEGENIKLRGPQTARTPDLIVAIRARKAELLAAIQSQSPADGGGETTPIASRNSTLGAAREPKWAYTRP